MKANKLSLRTVIAAGMVGAVFTLAALPAHADQPIQKYTCHVELKDGTKTKIYGVLAKSEFGATQAAKASNPNIRYIVCMGPIRD